VTEATARRRDALAFVMFLLLPALLLGDCLFGGRHYLPFDISEFPPLGDQLTATQRAELRATANYDATEAPIWFRSELLLAREALGRGQLPHWNGYVRNGAPMLAHGHTGLLNPLHWPALLFADPDDGLLCLTYTMFALAGGLMFGLLRAAGLGRSASVFGGVAFAWSGTMAANGHWFMRMEPLAMLPGLCWAMLAIARRRGRARCLPTAGLALATMATWMSGFPQYGIPVTLLAAGLGAALCLRELRAGVRPAMRLGGWLLLGGGLGMLLAMPQLLQMLQFYPLSNRPIDETLDRASRHAFSAIGFLGYVFPTLFSQPGDVTLPQDSSPLPWLWSDLHQWETGAPLLPNYNFTEYAVFPGTLTLLFAALALLLKGPRWRLLPIAALALVWVLATGAFGTHLAYLLPGIKTVPPYRFAGPACAMVAILAALGFDALRRGAAPWILRGVAVVLAAVGSYCLAESTHAVPATTASDPWLVRIVEHNRDAYAAAKGVPAAVVTPAAALANQFTVGDREDPAVHHDAIALGKQRLHDNLWRGGWAMWLGAAVMFALSMRRRERCLAGWPAAAAIVLTAAELFGYGHDLNRGQPLLYAHDSVVHRFLREQRDARAETGGILIARGSGRAGPWNLPGGTLAAEHIRDLNFYTFVDKWSDLPIRALYGDAQILRGFVCDALPDDDKLELPYWDLVGLRYVLATAPMQHAGKLVLSYELHPDDGSARRYFVYERPDALPRAWVVPEVRFADSEEQLIAQLIRKDLAPRDAVWMQRDKDLEQLLRLPSAPSDVPAAARGVTFRHEDAKHLVLEVDAGQPGYLVVADTFFPGWEVTVDDQPAPLLRGNLSQRVVPLGTGRSVVHFRFRALGFVPGLAIGGLAVLALLVLLLLGRAQLRRGSRPAGATA